VQQDISWRYF